MAATKDFMHLPLPLKENGKAYFRRPVIPPQTQTAQNLQNRQAHGTNLKRRAADLSQFWNKRRNDRAERNLPTIIGGIPFLLQIDPTTDVNFLFSMGFEVVCDLDDGFIVVASEDVNLDEFQQKIDDFLNNKQRSGSPARVYGLCDDEDRLSKILSKNLYEKWAILGSETHIVDLSIECNGLTRSPELPEKDDHELEESYNERCTKLRNEYYLSIDDIARGRQQQFEKIVAAYNGTQAFEYIDDVDSFSVRITISGIGLRDLIEGVPSSVEFERRQRREGLIYLSCENKKSDDREGAVTHERIPEKAGIGQGKHRDIGHGSTHSIGKRRVAGPFFAGWA